MPAISNPPIPDPTDPFEWHRLLGTEPQPPPSTAQLKNKRILITGAGGSIGSALAKFIATAAPKSLILLDSSETALYEIDRDLRTSAHPAIPILGSVSDRPLLDDLFTTHGPELILHTAAYKHVPLLEQNPFAAATNNILTTQTLLEVAAHHLPAHLLLVSTDKAVAPTSFMGATKRIAELLTLTASIPTTTIRLGNVLNSHGSVVPLFLDQLAHRHPLTVTHPKSRRYLLTLDQTVQALIESLDPIHPTPTLLATALTHQIRILDLAHHLIALHNHPSEIVFTSLRPGDKLEESFLSPTEHWLDHPRTPNLRAIATPIPPAQTLTSALSNLKTAIETRNLPDLLETVQHLVPDYTPSPDLLAKPATLREEVPTP